MNETQRRFLRRLRAAAAVGLPRSAVPKNCRDIVESLQQCGAAEFRPSASGRGVVLSIVSHDAWQRFISGRLPSGLDVDASKITSRALAVSLLADAKAVRGGVAQGILVRSVKPDAQIRAADGEFLPVGRLTQQAGAAVIELSSDKSWSFAGSVLVIENADVFWRYETVVEDTDIAVHAAPVSNRLLKWLASPLMHDCQITHWTDYDPVGVCEYTRLARSCPTRVTPFAPAEVDELLRRYGKRDLVIKQARYLERLRSKLADPYVARMVRLFDVYRRGLEQELLLTITCRDPRPGISGAM